MNPIAAKIDVPQAPTITQAPAAEAPKPPVAPTPARGLNIH